MRTSGSAFSWIVSEAEATGAAKERVLGVALRAVWFVALPVVLTALAVRRPKGWGLLVALFLLGLGWSCTLVSGSTMLTAALPVAEPLRHEAA